jgi:hypothetical protein
MRPLHLHPACLRGFFRNFPKVSGSRDEWRWDYSSVSTRRASFLAAPSARIAFACTAWFEKARRAWRASNQIRQTTNSVT